MKCDQARDLLSARLDGELDEHEAVLLEEHLAACADCRAHADELEAMRRDFRLHAAEELASIPAPQLAGSLRAVSALRWMLYLIGGTLVILNVSNLVFEVDAVDRHLSRHDGVFGTALGIGMLSVAMRPQRAIGLVPLTSTIAALMAVVAISDIVGDRRSMLAESVHVLEFAGLICLWVISGGPERLRRRVGTLASSMAADGRTGRVVSPFRRTTTVNAWPSS
ncbi:MAG: zf-HC2 domain-containing protein [Actinomycetota bacterium]